MIKTIIKDRDRMVYEFEEPIYPDETDHKTASFHLKVTNDNKQQQLQVISFTENPEDGFCLAGSYIQDIPSYAVSGSGYIASNEPLVSCIILLTFNDKFVFNFLIPSIVANTAIPYEIIIVYNGVNIDLEQFKDVTIIESETGCVSKGYNLGVAKAKGKYVAIFHDDCLIMQYKWHDQMLQVLKEGHFAASTESLYNRIFDFNFLKGTPLVLSKDNYNAVGGHDELFFAGIEDIDFSYRILKKGNTLKEVSMPYKHFNGMSTVILLNNQSDAIKTLFGYCLIPESAIADWKTKIMNSAEIRSLIQEVNSENMKYFKQKSDMATVAENKEYAEVFTEKEFPSLFSIRKSYQEWLFKPASVNGH